MIPQSCRSRSVRNGKWEQKKKEKISDTEEERQYSRKQIYDRVLNTESCRVYVKDTITHRLQVTLQWDISRCQRYTQIQHNVHRRWASGRSSPGSCGWTLVPSCTGAAGWPEGNTLSFHPYWSVRLWKEDREEGRWRKEREEIVINVSGKRNQFNSTKRSSCIPAPTYGTGCNTFKIRIYSKKEKELL